MSPVVLETLRRRIRQVHVPAERRPPTSPAAVYAIHLHDDRITLIDVIGNATQIADLPIVLE